MWRPIASFMSDSSSLLVTMITGIARSRDLIALSVSNPPSPGIISSSSTTS